MNKSYKLCNMKRSYKVRSGIRSILKTVNLLLLFYRDYVFFDLEKGQIEMRGLTASQKRYDIENFIFLPDIFTFEYIL